MFKLCCDPGDAVLVPEPSYPLFEYLARLEGVATLGYRLAFDGEWHVDFASLDEARRGAGHAPRAVVVVNPNNPTGSYLKRGELERLAAFCRARDLALISDEVFAPYPFAAPRIGWSARPPHQKRADAPAIFSLGGLSKACGLPHLKLGWIAVAGREAERSLAALELIADTYLSVSTPVQRALPELLVAGARSAELIAARVAANLAALGGALPAGSACSLLAAEGGWSAILRVPAHPTDGDWAVSLARETSVLVHPGYFFDMRGGTFVVVSLLPAPDTFADGHRTRCLAYRRVPEIMGPCSSPSRPRPQSRSCCPRARTTAARRPGRSATLSRRTCRVSCCRLAARRGPAPCACPSRPTARGRCGSTSAIRKAARCCGDGSRPRPPRGPSRPSAWRWPKLPR